MAITLTGLDTYTLNGSEGINVVMERTTSSTSLTSSNTKRSRSSNTPIVTNESFNSRNRVLPIWWEAGDHGLEPQDLEDLLFEVFLPWYGERMLYGEDQNGNEYQTPIRINSFGPRGPQNWEAQIEMINGVWESTTVSGPVTTSPITIENNIFALPVITLDNGESILRDRLTINDRTGHGVSNLMIPYSPGNTGLDEDNYVVYLNGMEVPFMKDGNELYFRVFASAPQGGLSRPTKIDVLYGTPITNGTTAGQIDMGGITDITNWTYTTDPTNPFGKPLSSAMTWHPGIVIRQPSNRAWTFGFDGENQIRLVDRTGTGTHYNFADDADSYIITLPVEATSITDLDFTVTAGYTPGINEATGDGEEAPERVMRCILAEIDGDANPSNIASYPIYGGGSNFPFITQWTFGEATFPHTISEQRSPPFPITATTEYINSDSDNILINYGQSSDFEEPEPEEEPDTTVTTKYHEYAYFRNVAGPQDFPDLVRTWIGCEVEEDEPGVYYLRFPGDAYYGIDIPLITMSMSPRSAEYEVEEVTEGDFVFNGETVNGTRTVTFTRRVYGDNPRRIFLFQSDWVDPETKEPLGSSSSVDGPTTEESIIGVVYAFVKYRTRDSEDWITAWEERVVGTKEGTVMEFSPDVDISGAVQIAVGLRPASTNDNTINDGTLSITSNPKITVQSNRTPSIITSKSLPAQRFDGSLINERTGQIIHFDDVVGAADGLVIDTSKLRIEANTGPFYGSIKNTGGTRLFDLKPGENEWSKSGALATATASFEWRERKP